MLRGSTLSASVVNKASQLDAGDAGAVLPTLPADTNAVKTDGEVESHVTIAAASISVSLGDGQRFNQSCKLDGMRPSDTCKGPVVFMELSGSRASADVPADVESNNEKGSGLLL